MRLAVANGRRALSAGVTLLLCAAGSRAEATEPVASPEVCCVRQSADAFDREDTAAAACCEAKEQISCRSPRSPSACLSLDEAVAAALRNHENADIAERRDRIARIEVLDAWSRLLPHASATGAYNWGPEDRRDIGGTSVVIQDRRTRSLRAGADLTLFDAPALSNALAASDRRDAVAGDFEATHLALAHAVAEAYVGAYTAERLVDAWRDRLAVAERAAHDADLRVRSGLAATTYAKRIRLEQASTAVQLAQAELDASTLNLLVRDYARADMPVALTTPVLVVPVDVLDSEGKAWEDRPDLLALRRRADAAFAELNASRLAYLPALQLGADWARTDNPGLSGREDDWGVGLAATWSLLQGGGRWAQLKAQAARSDIASLEYQRALRQAELEIQQLRQEWLAAGRLLALVEAQFEVAEQTAHETALRFGGGLSSAFELADALAQRHLAASELLKQQLERALSGLRLAKAFGRWPTEAIADTYREIKGDRP